MSKKSRLFLFSAILFLLFVLFSYLVQKGLFVHLDFDTTVKLQDHMPRRLDPILSAFSLIGSVEVVSIVLLIVLAIRKKVNGLLIFFLFAAMHVFEIYGKTFVRHKGPPFLFFRYDLNFLFPSSYVQPGYSYPSGHSARAFFLTTILGILTYNNRKLSTQMKGIIMGSLFAYDIVMGASRVYLGEHWTTDVIGGAILGMSFGLCTGIILPWSIWKKKK